MRSNTRNLCTIAVFAAALTGCGGTKMGQVQLQVTAAPPTVTLSSIVVTIDHVDAHVAGDKWQTIVSTPQTLDLATLAGGNLATIGVATVPAGQITQIRLYLSGSATVTTPDGMQHPLIVPSGNIKIVGFAVAECRVNAATLTFDGVEYHQADGQFILRPTVQVSGVRDMGPGGCGNDDDGGAEHDESDAD
jgi:uncharacterized protein DUF4382